MGARQHADAQDLFLQFLVGHQPYLAALDSVLHVERIRSIDPLPATPEWVDGQLPASQGGMPLLCFAALLGEQAPPPQARARVLIVEVNARKIGLRTDSGSRIVTIPKRMIGPPPSNPSDAGWIDGVATFFEQVVMIIDPRRVVTSERLRALDAALKGTT